MSMSPARTGISRSSWVQKLPSQELVIILHRCPNSSSSSGGLPRVQEELAAASGVDSMHLTTDIFCQACNRGRVTRNFGTLRRLEKSLVLTHLM